MQEFVATYCLPKAELQTYHQSGSESYHATSTVHARHVQGRLCSLSRHISGKSFLRNELESSVSLSVSFTEIFLLQFNTLNNALARCPHCRKISSVGPDFARGRGIVFIIIGIIALIIAIAVTVRIRLNGIISV